jgi:hypothetical protein
MNDTGLPSPFMLIMMLSPALRTSQSAFCAPASVICTTLLGSRGPRHSHEVLELAPRCACLVAHELHEQDRLRLADERRVDDRPERGIAAREVDHGAIDELHRGGPSVTM